MKLRKRYYIFFVCRDSDGEIRKIPIPMRYFYAFLGGVLIGAMTLIGIAGSYTRMLVKVEHYNELRTQRNNLQTQYDRMEQIAQEKEIQVASLGSLASEVSSLYGLKTDPTMNFAGDYSNREVISSLDRLYTLRTSALSGVTTLALTSPEPLHNVTTSDWQRVAAAPSLWPVEGAVTGSFGERIDPFNGEGAFHSGIDISSAYGHPVIAPADGVVTMAEVMGGYGRVLQLDHGHGISTRYGHLSGFNAIPGQHVQRGDVIGYVGLTGRSTGPHLHYEVRIFNTPVNPHKYLRLTMAQNLFIGAGM